MKTEGKNKISPPTRPLKQELSGPALTTEVGRTLRAAVVAYKGVVSFRWTDANLKPSSHSHQ